MEYCTSNSRERPPQYFDMSRCREEVEAELRPWYSGHQVPFPSTFCPVSSFNPQPNCVLSITIGGGGEVGGMDPPCICMDPPRVFFGSWILLDPGSFRILDPHFGMKRTKELPLSSSIGCDPGHGSGGYSLARLLYIDLPGTAPVPGARRPCYIPSPLSRL